MHRLLVLSKIFKSNPTYYRRPSSALGGRGADLRFGGQGQTFAVSLSPLRRAIWIGFGMWIKRLGVQDTPSA